jgi:DNA-binding NarL/FixJ family response regulator
MTFGANDASAKAAEVPSAPSRSRFMARASTAIGNGTKARAPVAVCVEEGPLRERLCAAIAAGGHAVPRRAASVEALLGSRNGTAPVCVVVAVERPDRAAVDAARALRGALEKPAVVLVCRRAGAAQVQRALELGVDGVVLVDETEVALAAVVSVVCAGQVSVPSEHRAEVRTRALTNREKQILALVVAGLTNAQIARELFLAESTVKSHLSSAFGKLGVSSRHEAARVILDPERGRGLGIRGLGPGVGAGTYVGLADERARTSLSLTSR